jgi:hypothetical protein
VSKLFTMILRRNVSALLLFCLIFNPIFASSQTTSSLCTARGYTVAFFNGVWNTNTPDGAQSGLNALRALIGDTYKNEPVEYQLFYNNTGSTVGATGAQDVAEVFIQRAKEFDATGELGKRFEYFWEAASNGDKPFFSRVTNTIVAEAGIFDGLYSAVVTKAMAGWSMFLSNPPTTVNYASHKSQLDTLAVEGQKLLLVAHSQGNLFVNPAYDYVKPKIGSSSVAVVHIAPASITTNGDYILASIDLVINGLRTQGWGSVPATNINILPSFSDLSGHTLQGTYLDASRGARARILEMSNTALNSLTTPTATASRGFFTATLTWDGSGDVDLHTFDPTNTHVYYSSRSSTTGYLDVDNTTANGPEHYYASCDATKLLVGNYKIGINNYSGATGRTATVQISFAQGGQAITKSLSVGAVRGSSGDATPISVFTVNVQKDANGKFTATAN